MTTIQAFSMGYLEDSAGDLVGDLKITGTLEAPQINGDLTFQNSRLNVAMLNADFLMDNQTIHFNNQGIQFRKFEIKDLRGNATLLNGSIATTTYTDFDLNLNLTMDDFAAVNEVYGQYFEEEPPARETVAVAGLPKNVHVEISVIAWKDMVTVLSEKLGA